MGRAIRVVWVAFNMATCAALFFWCAMPRETLSGLVGRYALRNYRAARWAQVVIDKIYWMEPKHCQETAKQECRARWEIYADSRYL